MLSLEKKRYEKKTHVFLVTLVSGSPKGITWPIRYEYKTPRIVHIDREYGMKLKMLFLNKAL